MAMSVYETSKYTKRPHSAKYANSNSNINHDGVDQRKGKAFVGDQRREKRGHGAGRWIEAQYRDLGGIVWMKAVSLNK